MNCSQISTNVSMHIGRNGSSICSATAITERRTTSEIGTIAAPHGADESLCVVPTSTIVRTSLIACSFSMANLLSRLRDLYGGFKTSERDENRVGAHLRMYQSSAVPNCWTDSASTKACRINRYAAARHVLERLSAKQGTILLRVILT